LDLNECTQADCEKCEFKRPELWEENREAWELWLAIRTQWRTRVIGVGMGAIGSMPMGLDYNVLPIVAKTLNIDVTPATLYKIQALEFFEVNRIEEEIA